MIRTNIELLTYVDNHRKKSKDTYFLKEEVKSKKNLIEQNKPHFYVYIIKSGVAKCYLTEDTGNDFIQEFFGEGELFGEIEIINEDNSICTIETISEMMVYKISKKHFLELLENDKKFNNLIIKTIAHKIKYKALRHSHNQSHSIKSNILRLRKLFPKYITLISKQDISNYLGISIRSLNRVLKEINL